MTTILGINAYHGDASASLVVDGQLVAALISEEEATVKRLRRKDGRVILEAENPAYPPMVFTEGVEILGIVVAVLRRVE